MRRAHLPGHRHADLRGQGAARRQPDLDAPADSRGGRGSDQAREAAPQLGRLDHRRELRQQPRPGHADHPFRSVGEPRHRDQADPQGRRLREHQRAVFAAGGTRPSRPRRSLARGRAQVHPARGVEGAGQGMQSRAPSACASAAIAPRATRTRRSSCSGRSTIAIPMRVWRRSRIRSWQTANTLTVGPMGFGGKTSLIGCKIGAQNRLPASFFVSVAYDCWAFRRLGVRLDATSGAITSWLYREATVPSIPLLSAEALARRLSAHGPRDSSQRADFGRAGAIAQSG